MSVYRKKTKKRPSLQESDLVGGSAPAPPPERSRSVTLKERLSLELKSLSYGGGRSPPHRTPSSGVLNSPTFVPSGLKRASGVEGERKVSNPLFQYADLIQASQNRNKVWVTLASSASVETDEQASLRRGRFATSSQQNPDRRSMSTSSPRKHDMGTQILSSPRKPDVVIQIPVPPPQPPPLQLTELEAPRRPRGPDGLPEEMSRPFRPRERPRPSTLRRVTSSDNLRVNTAPPLERKRTMPLERPRHRTKVEELPRATLSLRKIRSDSILYRFPDASSDSDSDEDDEDLTKSTETMPIPSPKIVPESPRVGAEDEALSSHGSSLHHDDQLQWEARDGRRIIVAGSIDRLIAQLIEINNSEKLSSMMGHMGPDYVYTFLLSHTYFTTSVSLMEKIQEHYFAPPPPGLTPKELKALEGKIIAKQSRIVNTLKRWIDGHYYFFEQDLQLVKTFETFMGLMEQQGDKHQEWAVMLKKALEERPLRKEAFAASPKTTDPSLKPILPINMQSGKMMFIDLHPMEVARQMTLIEYNLFKKIQPNELHHSSWTKGKSPNVQALTERFNKVCFWVATEIITTEDPYLRIEVLARFIQVALYLRSMNNFNGVMEIYASLNLGCVQRLKTTWKDLDKKYISKLKEIETMFDPSSNYKNYRDRLDVIEPPLIPFQAVFLADLTFIEEVPSHLKNGQVNFEKMHLIGKVISEVERYQRFGYTYYAVLPIEEYLTNVTPLSEKDLYDVAKKAEQLAQLAEKDGERMRGATLSGSLRRRTERRRPGLEDWMPQAFLNNEKQLKDLEKQEKKLQRSISFRQNKGRHRSSTYSG